MARARLLKPGFFTNDELAECPMSTRILFAGLWTIADREGRLEDRPKRIKAELLPYDDVDVDKALDMLDQRGFIHRYEVDGSYYIQIPSFNKHQSPHVREPASTIPAPGEHSASPSGRMAEHQYSPAVSGDPVSGSGSGSGSGSDDPQQQQLQQAVRCADAWTSATGQTPTRQLMESLEAWVERVGEQWVTDAITETGNSGVKRWKYTQSILERWERDGRQPSTPGNGKKPAFELSQIIPDNWDCPKCTAGPTVGCEEHGKPARQPTDPRTLKPVNEQ